MGRSLTAAITTAALLGGGCYSKNHPRAAYVADGLMAGGLGLLIGGFAIGSYFCSGKYAPPPDQGGDGPVPPDCPGVWFDLAGLLLGPLSISAGGVTGAIVAIDDWQHAPPEPPPAPPPAPVSLDLAPLPSLATDAATLQLAKQARMAAASGNCTVAQLELDRMTDQAYRDALRSSGALAACR